MLYLSTRCIIIYLIKKFNATKRTNQYNLQYIDYLINGANFDKNELFSKMHIIENDF